MVWYHHLSICLSTVVGSWEILFSQKYGCSRWGPLRSPSQLQLMRRWTGSSWCFPSCRDLCNHIWQKIVTAKTFCKIPFTFHFGEQSVVTYVNMLPPDPSTYCWGAQLACLEWMFCPSHLLASVISFFSFSPLAHLEWNNEKIKECP